MSFVSQLQSSVSTVGILLAAMALFAVLEAAIPLHARRRGRDRVRVNLALTSITFATNAVFNAALVLGLLRLQALRFGLLNLLGLPPLASAAGAVVLLDFSFYLAHVAMHRIPAWWRVHRVHHCDPLVDVTTTIRQHPAEGVIRYAFMAAFALALGASPAAFAVYRGWSALHGLLEHANLRLPPWLERTLVLVVSTPNMHKVHHSRAAAETDTNYSNLFSVFDRLFSTFTPAERGARVVCGLDGFDDPATQTARGLLRLPFRDPTPALPVYATSQQPAA